MKDDLISRQAAIDALNSERVAEDGIHFWRGERNETIDVAVEIIQALSSAEPDLSEAYAKAVRAWLLNYQIKAAELNGKYSPYEVMSWVVNDWRKEHE